MTISYSQGFLHTSGKEIIDGNGEPILLRGFGLGGWLVPEGYMLINRGWIEGFESPSQIAVSYTHLTLPTIYSV